MADDPTIDKIYADLSQHFPLNAFFNRVDAMPVKCNKRLKIWLGLIYLETNVGGLILIGYYMQWLAHSQKQNKLTLDYVCEHVFPLGVFTKDFIHEFWDKQKVIARPDNLVDHPTACASFIPLLQTQTP